MMDKMMMKPIGRIEHADDGTRIVLDKAYAPALIGLDEFSHVQVLWWFSGADNAEGRGSVAERAPYRHGPAVLGTFATRSPMRPNPIALDCAQVTHIAHDSATLWVAFIGAYDQSPVLDIKPYTPSLDRVEAPTVPAWCAHWPGSYEDSGDFDWESEMNA